MAARFSVEPDKLLSTLKSTVFKNATNDELLALVVVANEYGLNPLTKEIYAFPAKGGGIVPVISIDGWANMANSNPQYDGLDFEWEHDDEGKLVSCTCLIYRKDRSRPIKVTEYLSECKRGTEPWKMEHRMLRHKALSQCVRIAFGFGGVYDEDEAKEVAERVVEARVSEVPAKVGKTATKALPEPAKEEPAPVVQPSEPTQSPREQFNAFVTAEGLTLPQIEGALREHKLYTSQMPLEDIESLSEKVVNTVMKDPDSFLQAVKGAAE